MFAIVIWGAYLICFMLFWVFGMVMFWIICVGVLYEVYFMVELFLLGWLVLLTFMFLWVRMLSWVFLFCWVFGFLIIALVGLIDWGALLGGLVM